MAAPALLLDKDKSDGEII